MTIVSERKTKILDLNIEITTQAKITTRILQEVWFYYEI